MLGWKQSLEAITKELLERKWLKRIIGETSLEPEGIVGGKLRTYKYVQNKSGRIFEEKQKKI